MLKILVVCAWMFASLASYGGTITGTLMGPSGLPVKNGTLNFTLQQAGLMIGNGSVVPSTASCYTSSDGSVVGLPNPLTLPTTSIIYGSGTLPAGIYYVAFTFYDSTGNRTLASPELQVQLTGTGSLIFSPPASFPANAAGMTIFAGTASGQETAQGSTVGPTQPFTQASPPLSGAALPTTNTTRCSMAFNDTIIPYSGYNVSLVSSSGNAYPGWPQAWQLNGGLNGTVNISNGAPLWNGVTIYPQPILSQPLNHGPQSISGPLNMTGYNLVNVGALGVGTSTPAWPIDVENGYINSNGGYLFNGGAGTSGQCLVSNGTYFGPGSCGTLPAIYYQHVFRNGGVFAQEPYLNFDTDFSVNDVPGSQWTIIGLEATGVTAGSYTSANITVDGNGRVTAAANGGSTGLPSQIEPLVITSGICTTAATAYATCSFTVTWPTAFANSTYSLTCQPGGGGQGGLTELFALNKTATTFELTLQNGSSSGAVATTLNEIDCLGVHP